MARRLVPQQPFNQGFDVGEWLINYQGGFVRRGIFGEILLHLFNLSEPMAGYVLVSVQVFLYLAIITFLFLFIRSKMYSWSSITLCCSPAVGFFIFNNSGLTRKELLGLSSLVIISISSKRIEGKFRYLSWSAIFMYGISCFASEINALLLPSFLYILYTSNRSNLQSINYRIQNIILVLTSFICFGLSVVFHGNSQIVRILCLDVVSHGFPKGMCDGSSAIDWLGISVKEALPILMNQFPLYFGYLPLIFLAFVPILLTPWFRDNWRWCLACFVFIAPLYLIALDYGRWTFMLATEITIMIAATKNAVINHSFWNRFTVPIFIFGWGIPHWVPSDLSLKSFFFDSSFLYNFFKVLRLAFQSLFS